MSRALHPMIRWSPALQLWMCADSNFRACAKTPREAYSLWAEEIALRILTMQMERENEKEQIQ